MKHEGCGVVAFDGKPLGTWPLPIGEARKSAKRYTTRGFRDVRIVEVHSSGLIPLTDPRESEKVA